MKTRMTKCNFKGELSFCQNTSCFLALFRTTIRGKWKYAILTKFRHSLLFENSGFSFQNNQTGHNTLSKKQRKIRLHINLSIQEHPVIDSKKELKKGKNQAKQTIVKETIGRINPYIRPHTLTHTVASAIRYVHIIFYLRTEFIFLRIKREFLSE